MHSTVRALNIPVIIGLIRERCGISEDAALDMFYNSATAECYADDDTGLYGQSALHIYGLLLEELGMELQ